MYFYGRYITFDKYVLKGTSVQTISSRDLRWRVSFLPLTSIRENFIKNSVTRTARLEINSNLWLKCLLHLTNRLHFSVCVYCNRSQMTSQRVNNKKCTTRDEVETRNYTRRSRDTRRHETESRRHETTRDEVEIRDDTRRRRDCCSLHAVTSSVIYYSTHTRKNVIDLF